MMGDEQPNTFLPRDPPQARPSNLDGIVSSQDDRLIPGVIYACFILPAGGVTHVIGLVLAYVFRESAPEWLRSHYSYLIRTFWMGLLYFAICCALSVVLIGIALFFVLWLWFVVRCAVGVARLIQREPIANPTTWLI